MEGDRYQAETALADAGPRVSPVQLARHRANFAGRRHPDRKRRQAADADADRKRDGVVP